MGLKHNVNSRVSAEDFQPHSVINASITNIDPHKARLTTVFDILLISRTDQRQVQASYRPPPLPQSNATY